MLKRFLLLVLLMSGFMISKAQELPTADYNEISRKIEDWNNAWKAKDYMLASKWYYDDAEFTNASGENRKSKSGLQSLLKETFASPSAMQGEYNVVNQQIRLIVDNAVLAITVIDKMQDGKATRRITHYRVFKKKGEWMIFAHLISEGKEKN